MKKPFEIILGVVLMASAIVSMEGCGINQEKFKKQALEMLEKKYNETFYLTQYSGSDFYGNEYDVTAYSEEYPEVLFRCKVARDGSYMEDEYVAERVSAEVEEKMSDELGHLPGYYFMKAEPLSKSIDSKEAGMTPEEFMRIKPSDRFVLLLHYSPEEKNIQKVYQSIEAAVREEPDLSGTIRFTVTDADTLKEAEEYFGQNAGIYDGYNQIVKDSFIIELGYSQGTLQMSESEFEREAGSQV